MAEFVQLFESMGNVDDGDALLAQRLQNRNEPFHVGRGKRGRGFVQKNHFGAAVQRFRESWQVVIDRFGANRPAAFADHEQYPAIFMLVDARIVGALIVIDIGSRDAARDALAPVAETLAQLNARTTPSAR